MNKKVSKYFSYKKAFTLSEVLVTLVIIGVVAVMTVPVIMQSTGRHEYVSRLKKAHSVLGQALIRIAMQEGLPNGDYSYIQEDENGIFFDLFSQVVDPIKICRDGETGCIFSSLTQLNGSSTSYPSAYSLITKDGMSYGWNKGTCSEIGLSAEDEANCVGSFIVDINGFGNPNRFGYDIFFFAVIDQKGLVAAGSGNESQDCSRSNKGMTCAAKVISTANIDYL